MNEPVVCKNHVNFGFEDRNIGGNRIIAQQNLQDIQIQLGFLQYHHIYSVTVEVPKDFVSESKTNLLLEEATKCTENPNCKVVSIKEEQSAFEFVFEFHAEKEGLVKEVLKIPLSEKEEIKLEFTAKVLGPGKGTPLLKNGVKSIGTIADELQVITDEFQMITASDWKG